jgi:hypothetical protein
MNDNILTQIIYKNDRFILEREVKGMRMFWNDCEDCCIIVDKDDNILFAIEADCAQNSAFLRDLTEELTYGGNK